MSRFCLDNGCVCPLFVTTFIMKVIRGYTSWTTYRTFSDLLSRTVPDTSGRFQKVKPESPKRQDRNPPKPHTHLNQNMGSSAGRARESSGHQRGHV